MYANNKLQICCRSQNQDAAYSPSATHELALHYQSHHLICLLWGYFSKMECWWNAKKVLSKHFEFFWECVLRTNLWLMKSCARGINTFLKSKQANDHNKLPEIQKGTLNIQPQQTYWGQEYKWMCTSWQLCLTRPF